MFEVLPPGPLGHVPDLVYRRDLLATWEVYLEHRSTEDFVGRLRALFGPRPGHYQLRDVASGTIAIATMEHNAAGYTVPGFDANAAARDAIAAGHVAEPPPLGALSSEDGSLQRRRAHELREADARAPAGFAAIARRLANLVETTPPLDWEERRYDRLTNIVVRHGLARGAPFGEELDEDEAMQFLLERAEPADGPDAWNHAIEALTYTRDRARCLRTYATRLVPLWDELVATAETFDEPRRAATLGWLQRYAADTELA